MLVNVKIDPEQVFWMMYCKNGHQYAWRFRRRDRIEVSRSLGRLAANKHSDFSWWDVAMVSRKLVEILTSVPSVRTTGELTKRQDCESGDDP